MIRNVVYVSFNTLSSLHGFSPGRILIYVPEMVLRLFETLFHTTVEFAVTLVRSH